MRTTTITCAALVMGCASTTALPTRAPPGDAVHQRAAGADEALKREEGREEVRARNTHRGTSEHPAQTTSARAPTNDSPLPLVAFVEHRPTFCNGALCLKLVNLRRYPVARLWIDGTLVQVRTDDGLIWPKQTAYIRLFRPGEYAISAHLVDAVHTVSGVSIPTTVVVERCSFTRRLPTPADHADGYARADFDTLDCAS